MTILHSCCWWRSVRRGAFASVVYTFVYFGTSCIIVSSFLHEERRYLSGEVDKPISESFLEKETISSTTVIFNILLLCCAACGVVASLLVIVALKIDRRELLLPWICVMVADLLVECSHFVYLIILETLNFEPLTATLFTIDFFIMCLNVYCLLCVISQYQEYKAGRGGAHHDLVSQASSIQYVPPAPTNVQCNYNRSTDNPNICLHKNCTIIPEENRANGYVSNNRSPFNRRNTKLLKKHVQFPDEPKCCSEASIICNDTNGNGQTILVRSTPPAYTEHWNDDEPNYNDI